MVARHRPDLRLDAVGHRVVHGGSHYQEPQRVTPELIAILQGLVPLAPDHLPQAIQAIRPRSGPIRTCRKWPASTRRFTGTCPGSRRFTPCPATSPTRGWSATGFTACPTSTSCRNSAPWLPEAEGRVLIAHLGNGASMAAVRGGIGIDTTMGFTPAGGLMMGTRPGDLDPGVLLYLLAERGMTPAALNELVNREAGLLGVSGTSADMRDLLERESADAHAAEAVALFCYQARKYLGALAAVLGGLDTLVFTGGIGEHAAPSACASARAWSFSASALDPRRNAAHAPVISPGGQRGHRARHADR